MLKLLLAFFIENKGGDCFGTKDTNYKKIST